MAPKPQFNPPLQIPRDERIETIEMKVMELERAVKELYDLLHIKRQKATKRK